MPPAGLWDAAVSAAGTIVGEAASLPRAASIALVIAGLIVAVFGGRRPVLRVVTLLGGAGLGVAAAPLAARLAHLGGDSSRWPIVGALALLGAILPESVAFLASGGLLGLASQRFFPAGDRAVVFVAALVLGGAVGVFFFPLAAAVLTGLGGGIALALGLAGCAPGALGAYLTGHPLAVVLLGFAVGASGALAQLGRPSEAQKQARSVTDARAREIRRAAEARDRRFAEYARKARQK